LFSLLSVDSASGAFATNDEGTVMDAGGKKMSIMISFGPVRMLHC